MSAMDNYKLISSAKNPFYKELAASLKGRGTYGRHLRIEGETAIRELADLTLESNVIVCTEGAYDAIEPRHLLGKNEKNLEIIVVPEFLFERLSTRQHKKGVIAWVRWPWHNLEDCEQPLNRVLYLDRVQDPGNVGTLIRSAAAFDLDAVILSAGTALPWNEKVVRASVGAVLRIPVYVLQENQELQDVAGDLPLLIADMDGEDLGTFDWPKRWLLAIGNEGQGIADHLAAAADHVLSVSMPGGIESLNAGVAGSIMLYEAAR